MERIKGINFSLSPLPLPQIVTACVTHCLKNYTLYCEITPSEADVTA